MCSSSERRPTARARGSLDNFPASLALLAGLFTTTLVLVLFAVAAPEYGEAWSDLSPLGVIGYGWAVAMVILATGLGGQILLNTRIALQRDPRVE